jgi:hypothetical protein
MKKILILITLLLISSFSLFAQKTNEHLKFKGIPIDGTLQGYVQKMKSVGFTPIQQGDGFTFLHGDFAGYKNCTIGVATMKGKNLVNKITVIFPENNIWSDLYDTYSILKSMLTEKYGEPANCIEKFQSEYEPKDDNTKITEVQLDRCRYITQYSPKQGDIELSISHTDVTSCYVILSYFDRINSNIVRQKAMDDL